MRVRMKIYTQMVCHVRVFAQNAMLIVANKKQIAAKKRADILFASKPMHANHILYITARAKSTGDGQCY